MGRCGSALLCAADSRVQQMPYDGRRQRHQALSTFNRPSNIHIMPIASSSCSAALGASALRGAAEFEAPLQRLLASGALQKTAGGMLQLADEGPSSSSARRAAVLAAALLAPLLATYLEALHAVQEALASAGQGNGSSSSSNSKGLCLAAHRRLLSLAAVCDAGSSGSGSAGRLVVPSVALAQGAVKSFTAVGILVPAEAAQQGQQQLASGSGRSGALAVGSEAAGAAAGVVAQLAQQASGRFAGNGAVDEEYAVEPPTPEGSGALGQSITATAAAESTADTADSVADSTEVSGEAIGDGSGRKRQSLDRRRQRRHRSSSRSGSDSELDPAADSVAANLCQMAASPPRVQAVSLPPPPPLAGAGSAVSEEQRWVLAAAGPAMQQLLDRIEAFICI